MAFGMRAVLSRGWGWYLHHLDKRPLTTKIVMSVALSLIADGCAQVSPHNPL